jgi:hypothetical protein
MNCKQLRERCKELKIRGYSRFNKAELESAIYIKSIYNWYDDIIMDSIIIEPEEVDIDEEIISLNSNETNIS